MHNTRSHGKYFRFGGYAWLVENGKLTQSRELLNAKSRFLAPLHPRYRDDARSYLGL